MNDKLKVISYNCKGFKERNYDYLVNIYTQCQILLIQETWLYSFQQDSIAKLLKDSDCHSVSSMKNDDVGRRGRPFGGLAIVWKKTVPMKVTPISTTSVRLCAVKIDIQNTNVLIINVYMPVFSENVSNIN